MDKTVNLGGNILRKLHLEESGMQILASGPYQYIYYRFNSKNEFKIENLKSFTMFVLELGDGINVNIDGNSQTLTEKFCAIQCEGLILSGEAGMGASFLIAGTTDSQIYLSSSIKYSREDELYKVLKPWGFEIWVNGESHPGYSFKKIKINKGTKTSLQYHQFKQETNVIYEGSALFHYKNNINSDNKNIKMQDIAQAELDAVTAIDVTPNIIHRIEALTDILLYEISTPHLDDVIRIQDDANRTNGKIISEHRLNG